MSSSKKTTQKTPSNKSDSTFMSYSYSSISSFSKNGKQNQQEKVLQLESKNGKLNGDYKEKINNRVIVHKKIINKKDLKALI
jgi:hypothetical protein